MNEQREYWNFRAKQILYSNDFTEVYLTRTPQIIPFKVIYKGKYNKLRNKIKVLKNKRFGLSF
jgi:E3 ubiquitin-protein ligase DOA10